MINTRMKKRKTDKYQLLFIKAYNLVKGKKNNDNV